MSKNVNLAKINKTGRTALDCSIFLTTPSVLNFLLEEIRRLKILNMNYDMALIYSAINSEYFDMSLNKKNS